MQYAPTLHPQDPYADLGDDADGLPDGVASDICPFCGPVLLSTRDGRLEAHRSEGKGLCRCTPAERLEAEAAQDRRRRQWIDDRARRALKTERSRSTGPCSVSRSVTPNASARKS